MTKNTKMTVTADTEIARWRAMKLYGIYDMTMRVRHAIDHWVAYHNNRYNAVPFGDGSYTWIDGKLVYVMYDGDGSSTTNECEIRIPYDTDNVSFIIVNDGFIETCLMVTYRYSVYPPANPVDLPDMVRSMWMVSYELGDPSECGGMVIIPV
jgi:hypothetical protein